MALGDSSRHQVCGILLAAGAGSRFGGRKLLHALPDGTPVGVRSLRNLSTALGPVTAVVRAGDEELLEVLQKEGARVVVSDKAHLGMGHSLAHAIENTHTDIGWVVALGDMPLLRRESILAVADALMRTQSIVVPMFQGQRGHPVAFPARLRDQLATLAGDEGARALLQRDSAQVVRITLDDPGIVRDIDTREDLRTLGGPAVDATA